MKLSSILLFAEVVAAARLTQYRRNAAAKRAMDRKTLPKQTADGVANSTEVEYSSNWAGAVIVSTDVTSVTALVTVPSVSAGTSSGSSSYSCASAWVGIDGDTCDTAILQTGIDFCVENGETVYEAWYEWYPDYAYDFDLTVSEGDVISMTVTATSETAGTAVLENQTTGESVTHSFDGNVEGDLCLENAEWIVEDFESDSSLVPFADFGSVTFTDATATIGGETVDAGDYTAIIDIEQDNSVLTSCSASDETVTCTYV
ncbi:hypothetical protein N0V82_008482 [Gnomoniopsis sp. IMI 355080]|nr:hypothetical protein N0V82_008482 [Gnomoniopsis sp. IMI 355080]